MFAVGDKVRLIIDGARVGIVSAVLPEVDGSGHYLVFHDASTICEYYEDQIEKVVEENASVGSDPKAFFDRYLATKFSLEDSTAVFSLNSGNIKFIPYQFRPLKKIIKAERPRILISDEVGVGKTIEAGIVLKEYEQRENVRSVVIVCPKELCIKWQREMKNRFDETFMIMDTAAFSYCMQECELEGVWPPQYEKCIIGLEMVRQLKNIERMIRLEDQLHFDMLIVDEAHHVVNDSSNSYAAVEQFAENSDVAVFLSATPIQIKSRDLYVLLNLLLPEEFNEEKMFGLMAAPNARLNAAIRSVRNSMVDGWQKQACKSLTEMVSTNEWAESRFRGNRQLEYWVSRLSSQDALSDDERIACLRDLEDLNSFSHVINRTKRRDIGEFTLREPVTVEIEYSKEEYEFYQAAHDFEMAVYAAQHGARTAKMIMATIERLMTSCLPAFVRMLDRFIDGGLLTLSEFTDDLEEDDILLGSDDSLRESAIALRAMARRLPKIDKKTAQLLSIIEETKGDESGGKLLVFSFFKHTLRYLLEQIKGGGTRVALITGDTPSWERDAVRERFRLPAGEEMAIDVLLSSEVGCEGLDYEFCSRMVNYDIPWNPMKIEQRIGRIDRFGQKAPKVRIYNFITDGTIEERIFFRCYERLGVFNSTIGNLESVLGSVQSELTAAAFDLTLDEGQKMIKAQQSVDNAIRDRDEQAEFEANSKDLFLMDLEEDAELIGRERAVQMGLLSKFVRDFLESAYPTAQCVCRDNTGMVLKMGAEDKGSLHKELVRLKRARSVDANSRQYRILDDYLTGSEECIEVRFDSEAGGSSDALFVTLSHPFTQLALETAASAPDDPCIVLSAEYGGLPSGKYRFACYRWDERGYRDSSTIAIVVRNEETGDQVDMDVIDFESLLLSATAERAYIDQGFRILDEAVRRRQLKARGRLAEVNKDVVARKLSTLDESYQRKIFRARQAREKTDEPKIRTMREHQIRNLETAWEDSRARLLEKLQADVLVSRFAHGTIEVI